MTTATRFLGSRLDETPAVPATSELREHRQLFEVSESMDLDDVHESRNALGFRIDRDQHEARRSGAFTRGRRRPPGLRLQVLDEDRVCDVLDILGNVVIVRCSEPDEYGHGLSVKVPS